MPVQSISHVFYAFARYDIASALFVTMVETDIPSSVAEDGTVQVCHLRTFSVGTN